jgi:hypothetical protein
MAGPRAFRTVAAFWAESVTRSSVSTMMLLSGTSIENSFEATRATTRRLSSSEPSLAIVAEVPMH